MENPRWESRRQDEHGIDVDKEAKAKRLLIPQVRGRCERCSQLSLNAMETMLDVDFWQPEKCELPANSASGC
jgi:hypothetical protein